MPGSDEVRVSYFLILTSRKRVPQNHPLRLIRRIVNEVLGKPDWLLDWVEAQQSPRGI
jgi:hypothetical protein